MDNGRITTVGAVFCLVAGLVFAAYFLTSCQWAREMDEAIWNPPAAVDVEGPVAAPPLVEVIAAALALLGFGGMSAWIKRSNNRSRTTTKDLEVRMRALELLLNKDNT